jgi:hypothetical protein
VSTLLLIYLYHITPDQHTPHPSFHFIQRLSRAMSTALTQCKTAIRSTTSRSVPNDRARSRVVARAAKNSSKGDDDEDEAKIDFKGLKQLISMGLGTMSGDITEINLKDPKRTVVMELGASSRLDRNARRAYEGALRFSGVDAGERLWRNRRDE